MLSNDNYRPQRSCGKVMFSQAFVILFIGVLGVADTPTGQTLPWADTTPGQTPPRQTPPPHGQTPPHQQTATAADGTHPTGMHSCLLKDCTYFMSVLCTFYSRNGGSETQTLLSYRSYNQVNECQFTIEPRSDADTTEIVIEAGSVLPVAILCKARCVIIWRK